MMQRAPVLAKALFGALLCVTSPVFAQQDSGLGNVGVVQSLILTVEPDRLFTESEFGARIAREIEQEGLAIAAENRRIEAELTEEERALTEARETLEPDDFRARANAFDEKVQQLRQEQDAKARALGQRNEEAQRVFLSASQPILEELMRQSGAVAILDRRTVLLSDDVVDITSRAIASINAVIGSGESLISPQP